MNNRICRPGIGSILIGLAAIFLLVVGVRSPAAGRTAAGPAATAYKARLGPMTVATVDADWLDAKRGRVVPVRLYIPESATDKGPHPAIVLSHGLGGSRAIYLFIAKHLATYGYVVAAPTHVGSDTEVLARQRLPGLFQALADPQQRINRAADVRFVVDRLTGADKEKDQNLDWLTARVDAKRLGIAGHSFGAHTALTAVGQTFNAGDRRGLSFRDERLKAALAMSPQGLGFLGLNGDSWDHIAAPTLIMTGTKDVSSAEAAAASRRYAFDHMPPGDKYFLNIKDAHHMTFVDSEFDPFHPLQRVERHPHHHEWICETAVAFFDAYLKRDKQALDWLKNAEIVRLSGGDCQFEQR